MSKGWLDFVWVERFLEAFHKAQGVGTGAIGVRQLRAIRPVAKWQQPSIGRQKLYSNAAVQLDFNYWAIGVVIRGHGSRFTGAMVRGQRGGVQVLTVEAEAIKSGLLLAA